MGRVVMGRLAMELHVAPADQVEQVMEVTHPRCE
jgi:hypothetical protein